ncbi:MAG: GTP-binding protein [Hyphomicrobiales bacterium]|nr:GTP-binding protein [Hyphomicrobiales bacterium]
MAGAPDERDLQSEAAAAIPVTVLTGFLGSGKTTLLNALLARADMGETAVLVNEFGEVGLDHLLVREAGEDVVVLNSGCVCCSIRGDLVEALRGLFRQRVMGEVPEFRRVVVETTGLADPAPIIHTLMTDLMLAHRFRLDGIVTTVDAALGAGQLDDHPEAVKQAAVADRIVLTKTDMADPAASRELQDRLRALNPAAPIIAAVMGDVAPDRLFDAGLFDAAHKSPDVARWLNEEAYRDRDHGHDHEHDHGHDHGDDHGHPADVNRHDDHIASFCLTFERPLPWDSFAHCLDILLATKGRDLLRVKGILNVEGEDGPVVVHGVQHVFHPPVALPAWPAGPRTSRIVFITRDLGRAAVEKVFLSLGVG